MNTSGGRRSDDFVECRRRRAHDVRATDQLIGPAIGKNFVNHEAAPEGVVARGREGKSPAMSSMSKPVRFALCFDQLISFARSRAFVTVLLLWTIRLP